MQRSLTRPITPIMVNAVPITSGHAEISHSLDSDLSALDIGEDSADKAPFCPIYMQHLDTLSRLREHTQECWYHRIHCNF